VFPARYELNSYIVFRKRLVSKRLINHHVIKTQRGVEVSPGKEPSAPTGQEAGWPPRVRLDAVERRKILPLPGMQPDLFPCSPSLYRPSCLASY
jgi:hypothetical protein